MATDLDQFRADTSAWLEANCPAEMRQPMASEKDACWGGRNFQFQSPAQKQWLDVMASRGWTVPDWPSEYGGGGLSAAETKILKEEMAAICARDPLTSFGISMLGPVSSGALGTASSGALGVGVAVSSRTITRVVGGSSPTLSDSAGAPSSRPPP